MSTWQILALLLGNVAAGAVGAALVIWVAVVRGLHW